MARASVCLVCGDEGDRKLLIYCRNCRVFAVHHYCFNFSPDDDNIKWWCWDCRVEDTLKAEPSRKSKRISSKKHKALTMRNYWKQKLNRKKKVVQSSKDMHETGEQDNHDLSIRDLTATLVHERLGDLDTLDKQKGILENIRNSEHNESIKIDEPTFTTNSNLHDKQGDSMKSFDENREILDKQEVEIKSFEENKETPESRYNKKMFLPEDSDNAQNYGRIVHLQESLLGVNDLPSTSDPFFFQPYIGPHDSISMEPILSPVWSGQFNMRGESEFCIEVLAHLSNKACSKVSDAATAMPPMLNIKLVDKLATLPKHFRAQPPTAASIGLYFFPARERDERVYDSHLDVVIERDLALKAEIGDVELLIFPSSDLPLRNWRFNGKFFLWGVFKRKKRSESQRSNDTQLLELSKGITRGSKEELVSSQHADYPSQPYQSPVSMESSQSSNVLPSLQNTPVSLVDKIKLGNYQKDYITK